MFLQNKNVNIFFENNNYQRKSDMSFVVNSAKKKENEHDEIIVNILKIAGYKFSGAENSQELDKVYSNLISNCNLDDKKLNDSNYQKCVKELIENYQRKTNPYFCKAFDILDSIYMIKNGKKTFLSVDAIYLYEKFYNYVKMELLKYKNRFASQLKNSSGTSGNSVNDSDNFDSFDETNDIDVFDNVVITNSESEENDTAITHENNTVINHEENSVNKNNKTNITKPWNFYDYSNLNNFVNLSNFQLKYFSNVWFSINEFPVIKNRYDRRKIVKFVEELVEWNLVKVKKFNGYNTYYSLTFDIGNLGSSQKFMQSLITNTLNLADLDYDAEKYFEKYPTYPIDENLEIANNFFTELTVEFSEYVKYKTKDKNEKVEVKSLSEELGLLSDKKTNKEKEDENKNKNKNDSETKKVSKNNKKLNDKKENSGKMRSDEDSNDDSDEDLNENFNEEIDFDDNELNLLNF